MYFPSIYLKNTQTFLLKIRWNKSLKLKLLKISSLKYSNASSLEPNRIKIRKSEKYSCPVLPCSHFSSTSYKLNNDESDKQEKNLANINSEIQTSKNGQSDINNSKAHDSNLSNNDLKSDQSGGEKINKKYILGSETNKGEAEGSRPYFSPDKIELSEEDLVPPTNRCMSGCPNCVWIEYVEKLTKFYSDPSHSTAKIHEEVNRIDDQNIKALIIMELKSKNLW